MTATSFTILSATKEMGVLSDIVKLLWAMKPSAVYGKRVAAFEALANFATWKSQKIGRKYLVIGKTSQQAAKNHTVPSYMRNPDTLRASLSHLIKLQAI